MANVQRRLGRKGEVTWRVRVRIAGTLRTASFRRKTDAVQWAGKVEAVMRDGQHFPDREERQRSLADLIAQYRKVILPRYGEVEVKKRGAKLGWWERQLGSRRLRELTTADIGAALERLAAGEGLSAERAARFGGASRLAGPATQRDYLGTIRHVLSAAREWEWLTDNAATRVRKPREPRGRLRLLSADERVRLLAACQASRNSRLYPLVVVALATGARESELLGLRWQDIDLGGGKAIVQKSKNGERRALAITGPAVQVLASLGRVRRIGADLVFATGRGQATFPRKAWEAALRQAALDDFRFHDLRHAFASYLAMSGATLAELAEALGHKTLAMVKRYAHLTEAHTSGVVKRMTERFLS